MTPGTTLLDPDDKDVEQGLYLAVTETVVKKIFPCQQDLPLLAHVREVDVNDTELANGDDDGWLAVVLANRLPVFDQANDKPVRYMACLVNLEGQLAALPPPLPPVPSFEFALAQDWSVLAQIDPRGGPDPRVMGGAALGNVVLPSAGGLLAQRPEGAAAAQAVQAFAASAPVGASLDGAAAMAQQPVAKQWSQATQQVAAAALDPDAKRLVRDTMAQGFRFPIELYALEKVLRFPVLAHWSFTTNEGRHLRDADAGHRCRPARHRGQNCRRTRLRPTRSPRSCRPATSAWTTAPAAATRCARGTAGRACPSPRRATRPRRTSRCALAHSADQLRRVIPDGREDLSLAAAFEIGRLLALSQLSMVSALLRFRAEQFGAGRVREVLAQLLPLRAAGAGGRACRPGPLRRTAGAGRAGEEPRPHDRAAAPGGRPGPRAARRAATSTRSSPAAWASTSPPCASAPSRRRARGAGTDARCRWP